jgi:hypothetical protein
MSGVDVSAKPENLKSLVPDFVTALIVPPPKFPFEAEKGETSTEICSIASKDTGGCSVGYPPKFKPKSSFCPMPSTVKLFERGLPPAIISSPLPLILASGFKRATSLISRLKLGTFLIKSAPKILFDPPDFCKIFEPVT